MKWLEAIKIQTASGLKHEIETELKGLINNIMNRAGSKDLIEAGFYKHISIYGFYAINLKWDTKIPEVMGSPTGLQLSRALKPFALIDHSVWILKQGKTAN